MAGGVRDPSRPFWNSRRSPWGAQTFRRLMGNLQTVPRRAINNPSYSSQMCEAYTQPIQFFAGLSVQQVLWAPENLAGIKASNVNQTQPSVKVPQPSVPIATSMPWDL